VKLFRDEFQQHVTEGRCPFEDEEAMLVGAHTGRGLGDAGVMPQPGSGIGSDREGAS
jgi:hypothetical protein